MNEAVSQLVSIARDEADQAAQALAKHQRACTEPGCADCVSLAGHADRTRRQVGLLPEDEPLEMF